MRGRSVGSQLALDGITRVWCCLPNNECSTDKHIHIIHLHTHAHALPRYAHRTLLRDPQTACTTGAVELGAAVIPSSSGAAGAASSIVAAAAFFVRGFFTSLFFARNGQRTLVTT